MHPLKFALWLFIVAIIMFFAAFTSAYIVRQAEGNWLIFELPKVLWLSSLVILISSATMHWAYLSAKKDKITNLKIAIITTFLLGMLFLYLQFEAWKALVADGVFFAGKDANPSGSFLYVLTGLHGLHLISGLIYLGIVLWATFAGLVHQKRLLRIEMCAVYWHFLGLLWIYLFVFLLINHAN
ncbi:MAG: cytochrome c oxidase subunit 3 [Microscillaceae bacterium]|nr:cytochrome c oxidase subunit 3 [Microscillaceae bacterium]MDW8461729.1 cytochrome c oxidase subunit 3 [Cytophagales bacterium]